MTTRNEAAYTRVIDELRRLVSDTSVSKETARENLRGVVEECEMLLDSLGKDDD